MRIRFFLVVFLVGIFAQSNAEQLNFKKKKNSDSYEFHYNWLDHNKEEKSLSFSLKESALFEKFRDFKAFVPEVAQEHIQRGIYQTIRQKPLKGVRVKFDKQGNSTRINVVGRNDEDVERAYTELAQIEREVRAKYFKDNYYQPFQTYDLVQGIKPNHTEIADQSVEDLKPLKNLILEHVSIVNIRNATDFTLNFIQSIPYSTLDSRVSSSGAGFNPPLKVLWENQGDCDSKVTLTAAMLRMLMPRVKMVMVFIDQHALIGIEISVKGDEERLVHDGVTYVLAEPTGPALMNLGEISETSSQAIAGGHYIVETYHEKIN